MPLTDTACKNAKPQAKPYKLADSAGLFLLVHSNGSRYWRLKYRLHGKEKLMALGVYPAVTLAEAREKRDIARKLLAAGADPMADKREKRRQARLNAANTFEAVAREWHENQLERWSKGHGENVLRRLEINVFSHIGARPIAEITPPELLEVLRRIEKRGALELVSSIKQNCGQVFRYGIQTGRCERDAAADLKGALKTRKAAHYRTIDAKEIPDFIDRLSQNDARLYARTRRAIWLSLLTFCRPGEIRQACWEEIDLDGAIWTIPGEKMKMRRDHIVPLSYQSIAILREQHEETGALKTSWVFPSQIRLSHCMSDGTVLRGIRRLGYGQKIVAHGFRALARTTIREKLGYDSEIIERQLAHKASGPLGEAYDRTQFLDERRKMMQHWADYIDHCRNGRMSHGK